MAAGGGVTPLTPSTVTPSVSKNEPENLGGGKGILIQGERTGALSTLNNQSVMQCGCVQSDDRRADERDCNCGHGGVNTSGPKVIEKTCKNPWDPQSARVYGDDSTWHSLNANENGGQSRDAVLTSVAAHGIASVDCRNETENDNVNVTLQAKAN